MEFVYVCMYVCIAVPIPERNVCMKTKSITKKLAKCSSEVSAAS